MSLLVTVAWAEGADRSLPLPTYLTAGAAGADLHANLPEARRAHGIDLAPGERAAVPRDVLDHADHAGRCHSVEHRAPERGDLHRIGAECSVADDVVRALLADVLGLPKKRVAAFEAETELFGALPEFDSLAVANLLTGIEERLSVVIEDDDVEAEDFMTYGRLQAFAERLASR